VKNNGVMLSDITWVKTSRPFATKTI